MLTTLLAAQLVFGAAPDVLKLRRPADGEWEGIYLLGHKAGVVFTQIKAGRGPHGEKTVVAIDDTTIRATVGSNTVSRRVREVKTYAAKKAGPLLSLEALHEGDGGDIEISATFDQAGTHVVRTPKGGTPEKLELPPSKDVVENADLPRVVAATHKTASGQIFDSNFLKDKLNVVADLGPSELIAAGVHAKVERISVTEDNEKVAATLALDLRTGRVLELRFGGALLAVPEPEAVAKKFDTVDLFALTLVPVDKPLPTGAVPATVVYDVSGMPVDMRPESNRQTYRTLPDGSVEVTVNVALPTTAAQRPETSPPAPADDLQPTPSIESADPAIQALAKEIAGDEPDAFTATTKLSRWVFQNIHGAYGVSSDRATDVLKRREGDCTEHSLLLTALARAVGIPARLVFGLVYAQGPGGRPGLLWHEWVEIYAGGWISVDPTFGQPVADATHLQLGRGDQKDAVGLMGQLKIHVATISTGSGPAGG